jgi:hypothetical protein
MQRLRVKCGVWFSLIHNMPPVVWWFPFPPDIATIIVLPQCPHGRITNSNLEFTAEVLVIGILLAKAPIFEHESISSLCDNTPTVSWIEKMASKSASPITDCLLQGLTYMLFCYQAGWLTATSLGRTTLWPTLPLARPRPVRCFERRVHIYLTITLFHHLISLSHDPNSKLGNWLWFQFG